MKILRVNLNILFKIFLGLIGNRGVINERYIKAFSVLKKSLEIGGYTLEDYCRECGYHNVLIIGENELGDSVASSLGSSEYRVSVTVCTNHKIISNDLEDEFERWNIKSYCTLFYNKSYLEKFEKYDCVWIADYNLWLRYRFLAFSHIVKEFSTSELSSIILTVVNEKKDVPNLLKEMEVLASKDIESLHVYIPSCQEVCNEIYKQVYTAEKEKMTEDAYRLLFGYREGKEYKELCHEFNMGGPFCKKGILVLSSDIEGKYFNIRNGERLNINMNENSSSTVWVIGSCIVQGVYVEDANTISSVLQSLLKKTEKYHGFVVRAFATLPSVKYYKRLMSVLPMKKGDMVIFMDSKIRALHYERCITVQKELHDLLMKEDFFLDEPVHCNYKGIRKIAEVIGMYIIEKKFGITEEIHDKDKIDLTIYEPNSGNADLDSFLRKLRKEYVPNQFVGSIVMNCNPFTLGHRYLIEMASEQVDILYIFVVEEDKSFFSFEERLHLIQEGTFDLKNVKVIPSGKFILSADTFSEYFHKEEGMNSVVDPSKDVYLFAQYIAPCLNITKRFVGEEPYDIVTKQYNETMKSILPQFGIEVNEIPRKDIGGIVISASLVRKSYKEGCLKKVRSMIPESTYQYLVKRENNNANKGVND